MNDHLTPIPQRNKYYIQYRSPSSSGWTTDYQPYTGLPDAAIAGRMLLRNKKLVSQVRILEFKMTNVIDIKPPRT